MTIFSAAELPAVTLHEAVQAEAEAQTADVGGAGYSIVVESKSSTLEYRAEPGEAILYAGLRHGLTLPYECATGTCGSCRARIASGEVEIAWPDAPGHAKIKRERGDILMCQTRALSDCVLRVPSNIGLGFPRHAVPQHRTGVVRSVQRLTADVTSFEVQLNEAMAFDAGQFVVLAVPGLAGSRAYSMVNYAGSSDRIELVVKRKPSGGFSRWLFDDMADGVPIDVFGPLGRATFHPEEDADLLMAAGGSGIAGMMSILERATAEDYFRTHRGRLVFGVRTLKDAFYLPQFARHVAAANGNLDITLAVSDEEPAGAVHPEYAGLRVQAGMVHQVLAQNLSGGAGSPMCYIAGPPPMVDGVLRALLAGGHATPDRIRYDKFG